MVNDCQVYFSFDLPSVTIGRQSKKFMSINFSPGFSPGLLLQYSLRSNLDHVVHAVDEIVTVERSIHGCTEQH